MILLGATNGGAVKCVPCVTQLKSFADMRSGVNTASGTFWSDPFPECCFCWGKPMAKAMSGTIDDYGTIGGVSFKNNRDCSPGVSGSRTRFSTPTIVNCITDGKRIGVNWTAESSSCGPPTGILSLSMQFYFDDK